MPRYTIHSKTGFVAVALNRHTPHHGQLVRQYGNEEQLALANFADYSDHRTGQFTLKRDGVVIATAEYGCVQMTEVTA